MKRFWKRPSGLGDLEAELRANRPTPPQAFVNRMLAHLDQSPVSRRSWRPRTAIAALVAAPALIAFAAFGGLGYAASGVSQAASNVTHSASKVVQINSSPSAKSGDQKSGSRENDDKGGKPDDDQYGEKVVICHGEPPKKPKKFVTLRVSRQGAAAHLREHPFDYLGPCRT